jgi:hypothetical protein
MVVGTYVITLLPILRKTTEKVVKKFLLAAAFASV